MTQPAPIAQFVIGRAIGLAFAIVFAAALASAALTFAGVRLASVGAPYDALPDTPAIAAELLAHNAVVALWPLALVELGWPRLRGFRWFGDVLIAGQLLGHGALIGTALAQRPELWRYLPHLPVEVVALAVPAGAWLSTRSGAHRSRRHALLQTMSVIGLLMVAAGLETYAVPVI
jgi:hypothetical protein